MDFCSQSCRVNIKTLKLLFKIKLINVMIFHTEWKHWFHAGICWLLFFTTVKSQYFQICRLSISSILLATNIHSSASSRPWEVWLTDETHVFFWLMLPFMLEQFDDIKSPQTHIHTIPRGNKVRVMLWENSWWGRDEISFSKYFNVCLLLVLCLVSVNEWELLAHRCVTYSTF